VKNALHILLPNKLYISNQFLIDEIRKIQETFDASSLLEWVSK